MKNVGVEMEVGAGLRDVKKEEPTRLCGVHVNTIYSRESIWTEV